MTGLGQRGGLKSGALVLLVLLASLSCAESETEEPAISSDGILVCGTLPGIEPGAERSANEWYSVVAMNNKLRHFPDFAVTTGLESVSTCEHARLFFDRYEAYNELHPHFDAGEPLKVERRPRPDIPPEVLKAARGSQVTKLSNGVADMLSPVVKISNGQGSCTGSFIGRNWIMTAAHCLETDAGWSPGDPEAEAKVNKWYDYAVTFAGPQGIAIGTTLYNHVLQYHDPRYVGFRGGNGGAAFDFALLYVHDFDDGMLPNNVPNASGNSVPFMRVSLKVSVSSAASAWGWGQLDTTKLHRGILSGYALASVVGTEATINGYVPSGSGVPHICSGDSGGPLIDRYDIPNPTTGVPEPQYVAAGVLSNTEEPNPALCATDVGGRVQWMRTDEERDFIGITVADWYPFFTCTEKKSASASSNDYMECWGKPCKDSIECGDDEVCSRPGAELDACLGCSGGGCDCIYGQCLRKDPSL